MAINALIAGGVAPVKTTSIADREAKRAMTDGQLRMNSLNDDVLRENAYKVQQRNALNEAYAAENAQPGSGAAVLAARGQGSAIPEMNKTRTAQETAELTNKTNSTKLYVDRMRAANDELRFVKDVTGLEAWAAKMQSDPVIAQNSNPQATAAFMQQVQAAKQNPALFQQLFQQVALGADEFTKRTTQTLEQSEADKLQREQIASGDARAKGQLGLGYAQLAQQKEENERRARADALKNTGSGVSEAQSEYDKTLAREQAKLKVKQQGAEDLRKGNATGMLNLIDEIETPDERYGGKAAIDAATGSGIGALVDKGLRAFGASTDGSKAATQLAVIGNRLTLLGDKPAGAISNYEMGILSQAAGQLQDPSVPNEDKKAALSTVKNIMRDIEARGGAQVADPYRGRAKPTGAPAKPASTPAAPAGGSDEDLLRKYGGL